jgi:hypothetical protein
VITGTSGDGQVYGDHQFALARLDNDGWFDSTFNGGRVIETGFGGNDSAFGVVQTSGGGLVVGGTVNGRLALAGYRSDGSLNANFGTAGKVVLNVGSSYSGDVGGLALSADNRLLITGGWDSTTARLLNSNLPFNPGKVDNGGNGSNGGRFTRAAHNAFSNTSSSSDLFSSRSILDQLN